MCVCVCVYLPAAAHGTTRCPGICYYLPDIYTSIPILFEELQPETYRKCGRLRVTARTIPWTEDIAEARSFYEICQIPISGAEYSFSQIYSSAKALGSNLRYSWKFAHIEWTVSHARLLPLFLLHF